ncbi:MAG: DUF3352 domain-containing protein [Chloroflexi bacterium]|nr:DUF3352 domain-containing protein [Chloroflexota bacterium]
MSKRLLLLLFAALAVLVFTLPAAAQNETPISASAFVPEDFAGFITVQTGDLNTTLQGLNEALRSATLLQPLRVNSGLDEVLGYYDFIPFGTWFDLEQQDFAGLVSPWIGPDMVIGYRNFDAGLNASIRDMLLILSNTDILDATSRLESVLVNQDLPGREMYRGITLFQGDKASFAMTTAAVFIGPVDLIKAALDVQAGAAPALTDTPLYHTVHAAQPADTFVSAYVTQSHILPAVNGLLNGDRFSVPVLQAFGQALGGGETPAPFSHLLLNGGIDAAEVNLVRGENGRMVTATAIFHPTEQANLVTVPVDPRFLEMIPRTALLVHSGTDFRTFVDDAITALPVSNFASQLIGGLPFLTAGSFQNDFVTDPEAADVTLAVDSFVTALEHINDLDVETDLLDHLDGSYALALLPRPNFPLPVLNVPFDFILVGQVDNGPRTQESVSKLIASLFGLQAGQLVVEGDWTFQPLLAGREVIFRIGYQRNMIMIATSNSAAQALDAQIGDNRLINMDRWTQFTDTARPDFYLDTFVFYNTFFPQIFLQGGFTVSAERRERVMLTSNLRDDGLFELKLTANVPQ